MPFSRPGNPAILKVILLYRSSPKLVLPTTSNFKKKKVYTVEPDYNDHLRDLKIVVVSSGSTVFLKKYGRRNV
jgi:hypothetical protein